MENLIDNARQSMNLAYDNAKKTYVLATELNGIVTRLDIPAMSMRQAQAHSDTLRKLMPSTPVFVLNLNSI
jgi:hypothetical protein